MPKFPAEHVSEQLNSVACTFFGLGLNCSAASVRHAFEGSSFKRVNPTLNMFDEWYEQNVQPVLGVINEPVKNLRLKLVDALSDPNRALVPDDDVAFEKEASLQRQYCESLGGSKLYCQRKHPLTWDADSAALKSRLSCPANSSARGDYFSVPISTSEAVVLYLPLIDHEHEDVMLIANLTRAVLPIFQRNHRTFKTVRFQRFVAADGIALVYPAVSRENILPTYAGSRDLNDLRESPAFMHSSCSRQVVFVLDVSSKNMHFDKHHRSEALIFRIFRLMNPYDQVQVIFASSGTNTVLFGNGTGFVSPDARAFSELQTQLRFVLRSGYMSLDSGVSLAQDLLRTPAQQSSCSKKFLIVLSSDEASLLPATTARHVALQDSLDSAGNSMQPYFILLSMDSDGRSVLSQRFCSNKMIYRSIPPMDPSIYKNVDEFLGSSDFYSDAAHAVMNYCTFIFELFVVNGVGPMSANDMNKVVWSPPFYDPAAAAGSLMFTTSMPVYTSSSGTLRFRGTVEVDHVFFSFPSTRTSRISQSDSSVVSTLNKIPEFLGAKVGAVLSALGAGMSLVDSSFLMKLNALALPLQLQLADKKCGDVGNASDIFTEFKSTRSSVALALQLQWTEMNSIDPRIFVERVMKSPQASGHFIATPLSSIDKQSIFFRHSESSSVVFLLKIPLIYGEMAIPEATSTPKNCSGNSAACLSQTDGLLFMSNSSTQAGFVLSSRAFRCPLCARDSSFLQPQHTSFFNIHQYASGKSNLLPDSDLSLIPSAAAELNILASFKTMLSQASAMHRDISAASVTGLNGVSFVFNLIADVSLKSRALIDNSQHDWFRDAVLNPEVIHVSPDPASDLSDPETFAHVLSIGVVAQPQGLPWSSGEFPTKGIAAVAHLRIKSSWLMTALTSALLRYDTRHICMSTVSLCAIVNSRGYIISSPTSTRSIFQHVDAMYPYLAQALLDNKVFTETSSRSFSFSDSSDFVVRSDRHTVKAWSLNKTGPSEFRMIVADSLFDVNIARLPGVAGVLMVVVPRHSLNANIRDLELRRLITVKPLDPFEWPAVSPRVIPNVTEIEKHIAALSFIMQENSCEFVDPSWLLGVSIGSGLAVLFVIGVVALHRFGIFQTFTRHLFQRKLSIAPIPFRPKASDDFNRFQFKLCSPNDFPVQKSILRCVSVFHKAFASLEKQIIALNTHSLSKERIIADDIDGQRIKIQNYLEVLKKQRTLLHERIVSRM